EGHDDLAELDHTNPAVADLVVEVMLHWLRRGISGWRLDVAYAVPSAFWAEVTDRVRTEFPQAVFLGEVIHGDYAGIVRDGHLDTVTQYELWKAIWSSISDRNFWELAWAVERHAEFVEQFLPQTFVGNHDVNRIADQIGPDGAALAAVILATLPGVPSVYYGDEQGFTGHKGEGFDADLPLRPPLPDSPAQLAELGNWLYRLHQDVLGLRRRNPWLTRGVVEVLAKTNTELSYQVSGAGHAAVVRLELEPQPRALIEVDGQPAFAWPR
ncbi:MAG: alpha-amylase, partial [Propionibacteriales bacterium]|nr:alpha-amylase [Propionibacteriales bacterium]